ncbi:MAG: leucyl aminopeptidase [Deferribacteraceae bacterium]|jgi:leucyl aminopeptidase|nr:leucyl aminopeptidase [Deferribacteraceae bacterium]
MKILCRKKVALDSRKDAIVIPIYKNIPSIRAITGKKIDDELRTILDSNYFNFEEKEIRSFYVELNKKLKKIYLVNTPKEVEYPEVYRELGAKIAGILNDDKIYSISLIAFEDIYNEKKSNASTSAFMEGIMFSLYSFDRYKTKKAHHTLEEVEIITNMTRLKSYIDANHAEWNDIFKYVNIAKDLVNTPPNDLTPAGFADYVVASAHPSLKVTVLDEHEIAERGMNLITAVGKGSGNPPRFVHIVYNGATDTTNNVAIVGKGVTFDSGGTNLKPSGSLERMKDDMSGAAAVFAVVNLIASQNLPVNINAYLPMVENTIGGKATRPGDIVKSFSGKTVEILNTDAEGRLILADALYMATQTDPEIIIDIATLTGACLVALGDQCAGLFSNRKFLSKNISDISSEVGEDLWELPLYENYAAKLKSKNADLQNMASGAKNAGAIIAALFLKEFVENYPWIHLDIAGTAFLEEKHPVFGNQASGFGVRLIYQFIKRYYVK